MKEDKLSAWVRETKREDVHQSFGYHGWVVPEYKCVCMTVPKVACTTVKVVLHHLAGRGVPSPPGEVHNPDNDLLLDRYGKDEIKEMLSSPDWTRFCFVRNPYHRLFSAYKTKIGQTWDDQYAWLCDAIRERYDYPVRDGKRAGMVTFADFVHYLVSCNAQVRYDLDPTAIFDGHYNAQSRILRTDVISYDFIGRFENLAEDLRRVLRKVGASEETIALGEEVRNQTRQVPLPSAYSRELAGMAYALYRVDFEAFGYSEDSWWMDVRRPSVCSSRLVRSTRRIENSSQELTCYTADLSIRTARRSYSR